MANEKYTLNVFQGDKQVGTGDSTKVHVGLEPKEYPAGTFTGELVDSAGAKTELFDFPAVTVVPKTVAVTGVTMSQATATGDIGKTVVLTATVAPDDATDKTVVWTTSDPKIATVKDGTVTFVAAGTADITATAAGKSATTKVTVKAPAEG
ncbi:Ig-like domain-containing protein [Secundilactobacillus kimchicus]|uniref:Ig-like domain-containing protein n=1 Tax=Secundilactobacillus kimchicus TaxID=528209 RepID=UPI0024A9A53C|nr:Ig-like domain-containing protein [Secundilactobacillus kimchicus]